MGERTSKLPSRLLVEAGALVLYMRCLRERVLTSSSSSVADGLNSSRLTHDSELQAGGIKQQLFYVNHGWQL